MPYLIAAEASVALRKNGGVAEQLLPVSLTGRHMVTYGVWVAIDPQELQRVFAVWEPRGPRSPAHPVLLGQPGPTAFAGL